MKKRLSRKAFEAWLKAEPDAKAGDTRSCPIAKFSESIGYPMGGYEAKYGLRNYPAPQWRYEFATAVDGFLRRKYGTVTGWSRLTRKQALEILRGIK